MPRIELTREQVVKALEEADHDVFAAAARLGVSYRTLYRRMDEFGIRGQRKYEPVPAEAS